MSKPTHVRGPGHLERRFAIEEDGLLWLHACYGRGVDAFNAEDMLRAYEAGRAHPNTSSWKVHREGWFGGPAQDVSREGEAGSRSAAEPDANLAGPEGDTRPDHFNVHMHDWHGEADGIGYSCSSCSAHMTESGQISRPR
jgi:hypothetical protein